MYTVQWQYKTTSNIHSQEFLTQEMVDVLVGELKESHIVAWTCVVMPDGETLWY